MTVFWPDGCQQGRLKITRGPWATALRDFFKLPDHYLSNFDFFFNLVNMPVNVHNTDYNYMRTNNAIISNNQSKDFIALWCLHVTSKTLTPVYMQFPIACKKNKIIYFFFYCHYSHNIAQHKLWTQKEHVCVYWLLF